MIRTAKDLIRDLQDAIDDNGGYDVHLGLVPMDDGEKYGHEEYVSLYISDETFNGTPIAIITYN